MGSILATRECCLYAQLMTCMYLVVPHIYVRPHIVPVHSLPTLRRWFSIVLYMTFLFAMIVVLLNVLIAQMSNTYNELQENNDGTFNLIRAKVISRLQKEKLFYTKGEVRKY